MDKMKYPGTSIIKNGEQLISEVLTFNFSTSLAKVAALSVAAET